MKKITVHVPLELLTRARQATGASITDTIIEGLLEVENKSKRRALINLRGNVKMDLNLERTRK